MINANGTDYFLPTEVEKQLAQGATAQIPLSKAAVVKGKKPLFQYTGNGNFNLNLGGGWYLPYDRDANARFVLGSLGGTAAIAGAATVGIPATVGTMLAGKAGSDVVNGVTKAITGKDWDTHAGNFVNKVGLSPEFGVLLNPGGLVGGAYGTLAGKSAGIIGTTLKSTPFSNMGWKAKSAVDVLFSPYSTYKALKQDKYILDFSSLRRNAERMHGVFDRGKDYTRGVYKDLTGIEVPRVKDQFRSWKHFNSSTVGFFDPLKNKIYSPLTRFRFSNIVAKEGPLLNTGGHEQAHAANAFLNSNFQTPTLGIRGGKWLKIFRNRYYLPNKMHPIAKKYYWKFNLNPFEHGRFPEETWANYMGNKAQGRSNFGYYLDNFAREIMFPPKGFIRDYKNYLRDTYGNSGVVF